MDRTKVLWAFLLALAAALGTAVAMGLGMGPLSDGVGAAEPLPSVDGAASHAMGTTWAVIQATSPWWISFGFLWFVATRLERTTRPISDERAMIVMALAALTLFLPGPAFLAKPLGWVVVALVSVAVALVVATVLPLVRREDRSGLDVLVAWFALSTGLTLLLATTLDRIPSVELMKPLLAQFPLLVALVASRCLDMKFVPERGWLLRISVPLLLFLGVQLGRS